MHILHVGAVTHFQWPTSVLFADTMALVQENLACVKQGDSFKINFTVKDVSWKNKEVPRWWYNMAEWL